MLFLQQFGHPQFSSEMQLLNWGFAKELSQEDVMEHITIEEREVIKHLHLGGRGIDVIAHAPQQGGGCHPFVFLRGVLSHETYAQAYDRVKPDILQHIATGCSRSCTCDSGLPAIYYMPFGKN